MDSKAHLLTVGFTVPQAEAIIQVILQATIGQVKTEQAMSLGAATPLQNTIDGVTRACDLILAGMAPDDKYKAFIESLKANVAKYKTLTPKQFASLEKFHSSIK